MRTLIDRGFKLNAAVDVRELQLSEGSKRILKQEIGICSLSLREIAPRNECVLPIMC